MLNTLSKEREVLINGNVDMFYNVNLEIQRALEKQKEEIIAAEMARRRELEAEVREEMRIERELALRIDGGNAFDRFHAPMEPWGESFMPEAEGKLRIERELALRIDGGNAFDRFRAPMEPWGESFMPEAEGKLRMSLEERLRIQRRTETSGMDMLPFQRTSLASKIYETGPKKKAKPSGNKHRSKRAAFTVGLGVHQELKAKPSANLSGRKRKFESAGRGNIRRGLSGAGNKRRKKAWSCDLCQVCATSKRSLNDHLVGKKHKAMISKG